jgi:hypothetical protein
VSAVAPIATAGGTFDRSERPIYFSAGGGPEFPTHLLLATEGISGPAAEDQLQRLFDAGHKILLDSGVFALTNIHKRKTGCTMDEALALAPEEIDGFDQLFEHYVHLTTTYGDRFWGYIELDQGGMANKRRTRQRLHGLGLNPIPVYHPLNDGWDYFDEIAAGYDRLCFGNVVQASQWSRVRLLHTMWERRRQYPHLWIHVLGLTANEWCLSTPPDSCDSSTWMNGLRYPRVTSETCMLRRCGYLGSDFLYSTQHGTDRDRNVASVVYADSVTSNNDNWHAAADRIGELGAAPHPPRMDNEGALVPGKAAG